MGGNKSKKEIIKQNQTNNEIKENCSKNILNMLNSYYIFLFFYFYKQSVYTGSLLAICVLKWFIIMCDKCFE